MPGYEKFTLDEVIHPETVRAGERNGPAPLLNCRVFQAEKRSDVDSGDLELVDAKEAVEEKSEVEGEEDKATAEKKGDKKKGEKDSAKSR